MGKSLFIAEKPSVAQEFAKALGESMTRYDGYQESQNLVVTWCVGHLVKLSYPEAYDLSYKKWSFSTLPFIPQEFKYEIISNSRKQYAIVKKLLLRQDVDRIYVCTDSGREGEYIYRLVRQEAHVTGKEERRVWIDSQTEEEIRRGVREAKPISAYDNLAAAAYLRAQEDYLMGINFSRVLTLRYGNSMAGFLGEEYCVVSVGRVMTCVQGMVVERERQIRDFKETPFYRVLAKSTAEGIPFHAEWKAVEGSKFFKSPALYSESGFLERKGAEELIAGLLEPSGQADLVPAPGQEGKTASFEALRAKIPAAVFSIEKKKEKKNPPLLYNLAELQNDCSRMFKISPDQTLKIVQDLYEKKLVTYPRTDARVLSSAIAKEINRNISGLLNFGPAGSFAKQALDSGSFKSIGKSRYTDDSQITDHYALIPTGQGLSALNSLDRTSYGVYSAIVKRFLSIFFPPAVYRKISLVLAMGTEKFFASFRILEEEGYLAVMKKPEEKDRQNSDEEKENSNPALLKALESLRKGQTLEISGFEIREGKTSPPKRYNSGSMILAMENAGQLIEDEELREQIKSCGIGTSATRAEILKKLVSNRYLALNTKTQILTPTLMGEMIYDIVRCSIRSLLNPALTASWEKGLGYVADGSVSSSEYMQKLNTFVSSWTNQVKNNRNEDQMLPYYQYAAQFYKGGQNGSAPSGSASRGGSRTGTKTGSRKRSGNGGSGRSRKTSGSS